MTIYTNIKYKKNVWGIVKSEFVTCVPLPKEDYLID